MMRRSQGVVALLVSLIAWQGVMVATSAMSQGRPAGFQDFLRKGDVASLAAVIDKDPSLANRLDARVVASLTPSVNTPKRLMASRFALPAIYAPPALIVTGYLLATWLTAGRSGGPAAALLLAALVVVFIAFALSVAALVHGYARASASFRSAWGLNALLVCMVLGLAPIVPTAMALVAPRMVLPGSEHYDIVWVLIPFALARATVRHARATTLGQANGEGATG